jgi:hypothetical protein
MDKLLEILGANKLNEDDQSQVKERLETLIEVKGQELSQSKLQEAKEQLVESYETKFEEYKEDITSKFSNFVDSVLEEEMTIPDKVLEFAKKGELYHDLIEQFKIRLSVDEGLLDEEVKNLLKEAKGEILKLRSDLDENIAKNLEVISDAQELASELYLRRKCDGLTESQKKRVLEMLSGIKDRAEIDRKFDIVLEAYDDKEEKDDEEEEDDEKKEKKKKDKEEEEEDEDEKKKKDEEEEEEDKKKKEDKKANEGLNEDSPFKQHLKEYQKILREGRF